MFLGNSLQLNFDLYIYQNISVYIMIQQYTDENLNIWKDIFHFIDQPFQAHLNELALNAAAKK